jgi:hypothetical protein
LASREASKSAVASPMPLLAPVMATTLPSIPGMGSWVPFLDLADRLQAKALRRDENPSP